MTAVASKGLTLLQSSGRWQLAAAPELSQLSEAARALAALMATVFEPSVAAMAKHFGGPLPGSCAITVVLGSEQAALDWDVDTDALGFHAVASGERFDPEEPHEPYYEVNHEICAYVNLEALVRCVQGEAADEFSLQSALMTLPHEMQHAAAWLVASDGRTPLEVFDEGEGELALLEMGRKIECQAAQGTPDVRSQGDAAEDAAELFAHQVLDELARSGLVSQPLFHQALKELRS